MLPHTKFRFIWPNGFRGEESKNRLWLPCLLTDWDGMSNRNRGFSIDVPYQVSVHLAEGFQKRRLKWEKLTDDRRQVMAKADIAFGKVS